MRIDLHTHSSVSDGTDQPDELVRHAADAGLDVIALTDHDTFAGWPAALTAAPGAGVTVVCGVEMSTTLRGAGVHLLGYLPDPDYPPLVVELERIRAHRSGRLATIIERLAALGVEVSADDVRAVARDASSLGRPHVADALIARGYVADRAAAFHNWLAEGGPAYVSKYSPATAVAINLIRAAGGVAVLAHPWGRSSRRVLTPAAIASLAEAGLAGIEVDHDDHSDADRAALRALAVDLDLVVTGSSDHHGTGKTGHPLGMFTTDRAAYERLLELAAQAAEQAGSTGSTGSGTA